MSFNITDPVFHDEEKARAFLEAQRWPNGPVCPYCNERENVVRLGGEAAKKGQVLCRPCRKKFTVTVGTVMACCRQIPATLRRGGPAPGTRWTRWTRSQGETGTAQRRAGLADPTTRH